MSTHTCSWWLPETQASCGAPAVWQTNGFSENIIERCDAHIPKCSRKNQWERIELTPAAPVCFWPDLNKNEACGRPATWRAQPQAGVSIRFRCSEHTPGFGRVGAWTRIEQPKTPVCRWPGCDKPVAYRAKPGFPTAVRERCVAHTSNTSIELNLFESIDLTPIRTLADVTADLEQIVASAESDLDDTDFPDPRGALEAVIYRVRVAVGLIDDTIQAPRPNLPMIGGPDRCLITVEHDHSFCGKPAAHR